MLKTGFHRGLHKDCGVHAHRIDRISKPFN